MHQIHKLCSALHKLWWNALCLWSGATNSFNMLYVMERCCWRVLRGHCCFIAFVARNWSFRHGPNRLFISIWTISGTCFFWFLFFCSVYTLRMLACASCEVENVVLLSAFFKIKTCAACCMSFPKQKVGKNWLFWGITGTQEAYSLAWRLSFKQR